MRDWNMSFVANQPIDKQKTELTYFYSNIIILEWFVLCLSIGWTETKLIFQWVYYECVFYSIALDSK